MILPSVIATYTDLYPSPISKAFSSSMMEASQQKLRQQQPQPSSAAAPAISLELTAGAHRVLLQQALLLRSRAPSADTDVLLPFLHSHVQRMAALLGGSVPSSHHAGPEDGTTTPPVEDAVACPHSAALRPQTAADSPFRMYLQRQPRPASASASLTKQKQQQAAEASEAARLKQCWAEQQAYTCHLGQLLLQCHQRLDDAMQQLADAQAAGAVLQHEVAQQRGAARHQQAEAEHQHSQLTDQAEQLRRLLQQLTQQHEQKICELDAAHGRLAWATQQLADSRAAQAAQQAQHTAQLQELQQQLADSRAAQAAQQAQHTVQLQELQQQLVDSSTAQAMQQAQHTAQLQAVQASLADAQHLQATTERGWQVRLQAALRAARIMLAEPPQDVADAGDGEQLAAAEDLSTRAAGGREEEPEDAAVAVIGVMDCLTEVARRASVADAIAPGAGGDDGDASDCSGQQQQQQQQQQQHGVRRFSQLLVIPRALPGQHAGPQAGSDGGLSPE